MDWHQLLNKARLGGRSAKDESGRTAFLRDHDKIIFSGAPAGPTTMFITA